jgi:hypothetical protein
MILESRHGIKLDLKAYGEFELAEKIDSLSDEELNQIGILAAKYISQGGYLSKHITLGAIEFFEGNKREPIKMKRNLSVYDEKEPEPKENTFSRIFKLKKKN